jgi:hypothetical protein
MLYEDPSVDTTSDKRFHVELHFSSGAYADFDAPAYLIKTPPENIPDNNNDDHNSSGSGNLSSPNQSCSPNPKYKIINNYLNRVTDKRSTLSSLPRRFPNKLLPNQLQTLPEPIESNMPVDFSKMVNDEVNTTLKDLKPRSFEDEHNKSDF